MMIVTFTVALIAMPGITALEIRIFSNHVLQENTQLKHRAIAPPVPEEPLICTKVKKYASPAPPAKVVSSRMHIPLSVSKASTALAWP